jgi:hypothetical protein
MIVVKFGDMALSVIYPTLSDAAADSTLRRFSAG